MDLAQKEPTLLSCLKNERRLAWVGSAFLLFYSLYLVFFFRLTVSITMNLTIAVLVFFGTGLFWYYLAYRWAVPGLALTRFHQRLMQWLSAVMLGIAVAIWLVQNQKFPSKLLETLNQFVPVLEGKPVAEYSPYFPMLNIIYFSTAIAICLLIFLFLVLRKKNNSLFIKNTQRLVLFSYAVMLFSVTSCVFATDALEIGPGQQSIIFDGGTESYVTYRLSDDTLTFWQDLRQYGGFMYGINASNEFQIYLSSTGFYGSILKLGQGLTKINPDDFIKGCRLLFALILAGMLTALSLKIKKKSGWIASVLFSFFPLITFWFIGPATHLIWFYFILFVPIFLSIYLYPRVLQGKLRLRLFLLITFIGEVLLFLLGYTYTPVLIASAAIPVFFYNLQAKRSLKDIFNYTVMVCLAGLAAFGVVIGIHFAQLWLYMGTAGQALEYLRERAVTRGSTGDTNLETPGIIFQKWLLVRVLYLSRRFFALFPQWREIFDRFNNFGNLHLLAFFSAGVTVVLKCTRKARIFRDPQKQDEINLLFNLSLTMLAAMLASWSWFPALGHMSHHYHMNGIMFMVPFGLTLFVLLGVLVQTLLRWLVTEQKQGKSLV